MPREATASLFDEPDEPPLAAPDAPLAERMRPRHLDEFVGQSAVVGEKSILGSAIRREGKLSSLILWGPPGSGKTTLARLVAAHNSAEFIALSAVLAGVKDVRAAIEEARKSQRRGAETILFIDEIHRFNKAQQDALLGAVEDGTITLIGATTENPIVRGQLCACFLAAASSCSSRSSRTSSPRSSSSRSKTPNAASHERIHASIPSLIEKLAAGPAATPASPSPPSRTPSPRPRRPQTAPATSPKQPWSRRSAAPASPTTARAKTIST